MPYFILTPALFQKVPVSLNGIILVIFELVGFFLEAFDGLQGDLSFYLVQIFVIILNIILAKVLKIPHISNILLDF